MTEWQFLAIGGAGGLLAAAAVDHVVAVARRWWWGNPATAAHFSPNGGCKAVIVGELAAARSEVLVQAYSFTCPDIVAALIAAADRGVRVCVLLDKSNESETYSAIGALNGHGIDVRVDASHAIAHNKVMVIDGWTVLTGSFNFTRQAEKENAENLLVLRSQPDLADLYKRNFHAHRDHSHAPGEVTLKAAPAHTRGHATAR